MKITEFVAKESEKLSVKFNHNTWTETILQQKKSAEIELPLIYKKLCPNAKLDCKKFFVLRETPLQIGYQTMVYIYEIHDIVYYGPDLTEYPVTDMSLWPWNVNFIKNPTIFKADIWCVIFKYCSLKDVLNVKVLNRAFRRFCIWKNRIWGHFQNQLRQKYPLSNSLFENPFHNFVNTLRDIVNKPEKSILDITSDYMIFLLKLLTELDFTRIDNMHYKNNINNWDAHIVEKSYITVFFGEKSECYTTKDVRQCFINFLLTTQ